jgi:tRNA threonylcarbamoyladenosine biosynthesis protein TsaE
MRELGAVIGRACRGGDVLILSGDLGAGKTTFTQGVALGIGIEEPVTSPTFVIARAHPNQRGGPGLVHVDAYRLGSRLELDDLDLDADLDHSVVVVEWGGGMAEGLADAWVDLVLTRSEAEDDETRVVVITPHGSRWDGTLTAGILQDGSSG